MKNRITEAIQKCKATIDAKKLSEAKLKSMHKSLDMDFEMYCDFQNRKSIASMDGRLTLDEANTVYRYLGNIPDTFNRQPIEVKYVLYEVYMSLLPSV